MRLRQHLPDGLVKTAQNTVHQRSLVDGHSHRLPDFFIVERGLGGVQAHIGHALGRLGQHLGLGRVFQRRHQVGIEGDRQVTCPSLQVGDPRGCIGHGTEHCRWERAFGAPIFVIAHQRHLHATLPSLERVGAAADGLQVEGILANGLDHRFGHDREFDQLGQQGRVGAIGGQPHGIAGGDLGLGDLVKLAQLRAAELGVGDAAHAVGHVLGRELLAVVEQHVGPDLELDHRIRHLLPGGGDLRHDLTLVVAGDQVVKHVAVDRVAVRVPLHMRVERRGLVDQVNDKTVLGGKH